MKEKRLFWTKVMSGLVGCTLIGMLFWSFFKEDPISTKNFYEKTPIFLEDSLLDEKEKIFLEKSPVFLDTEPNCADEECRKELELETPIFSGIPEVLQTGCNLYFDHNDIELEKKYLQLLGKHLNFLKNEGKNHHVVIEAYVDPQECINVDGENIDLLEERQLTLSIKRAEYIRSILEKNGIKPERIDVLTYGAKGYREESEYVGKSSESNRRVLLTYRTH